MPDEEEGNQEQPLAETPSEETPATTTEVEQPATLTEERVQQIVAEATEKAAEATKKAVVEAKQAGRQELQSQQALNRNAETRARLAESKAESYETSFSGLDDDTRRDARLKFLETQETANQTLASQEETRKQQEVYSQQLDQSLKDEVVALGIDPEDKGIDWAKDASDYFAGRKRFISSISDILKENAKVAEKTQTEKFAEMERKLRVDLGLESHDTSIPASGGSDDDDFIAKYNSGDLNSPADHKRAAAILNKQ